MTEIVPSATGYNPLQWTAGQVSSMRNRFQINKTVTLNRIGVYSTQASETASAGAWIWNASGTLLASTSGTITATNGYPPGWLTLSTPITLLANTTYYVGWSFPSAYYYNIPSGSTFAYNTTSDGLTMSFPAASDRASWVNNVSVNGVFSNYNSNYTTVNFPVALDVVESNTKTFNGTSWVTGPRRVFNGTSWVDTGQTKVKGVHF